MSSTSVRALNVGQDGARCARESAVVGAASAAAHAPPRGRRVNGFKPGSHTSARRASEGCGWANRAGKVFCGTARRAGWCRALASIGRSRRGRQALACRSPGGRQALACRSAGGRQALACRSPGGVAARATRAPARRKHTSKQLIRRSCGLRRRARRWHGAGQLEGSQRCARSAGLRAQHREKRAEPQSGAAPRAGPHPAAARGGPRGRAGRRRAGPRSGRRVGRQAGPAQGALGARQGPLRSRRVRGRARSGRVGREAGPAQGASGARQGSSSSSARSSSCATIFSSAG
jgi:hypothetical protein